MLQSLGKRYYRNRWREKVLNDYLDYLRKKGDKPSTISWSKEKGLIFWEWLNNTYPESRPVDNNMILAYFDYRRSCGIKESTIAGDARVLFAFFKWCYATGRLDINPCAGLRKPRHTPCEQEPYTPAEISRIITYLNNQNNYRDVAIILFLADTGIRITAMTNITKFDIDMSRRVVKVKDKYDKRRRLSWGDRTNKALWDYMNTRKDTCEYLFTSERKPVKLTRSGVYRLFKRACEGAHVEFRKPHLLRTYFASQFLLAGGPERAHQLRMAMGLSDNSQLESVYAAVVMRDQAMLAMQELSPGDRIPALPPPPLISR